MANFSIQSVVDSKTIAMSGFNSSSKANMRLAMRSESGADGVSFSADALNKLKDSAAKSSEGIKGTKVTGSFDSNVVEFNSANGKLSVGGTELKLGQGGFANALKDNISVEKKTDGTFVVNNLSNSTNAVFDSSGNIVKKTTTSYFDKDNNPLTSADGADSTKTKTKTEADIKNGKETLANALLINNSGADASAVSAGSNMVINRAAGATIKGTSGADKLFNLNAGATAITGSGGNDAVYSVGLNTGATINMAGSGSEMSYVKLLGNMKGGSVNMTGDTALLDASGKTLNGVKVSGSATTSAVVANSLTGDGSSINMSGSSMAAVDLKKVNMGSVSMGTGSNSVFIDSVTGNAAAKAKITTAGDDTLRIKNMNNADLTQTGNKSSWMKLVSGMSNGTLTLGSANNSLDASKANFNKASITQTNGTGATAISAKSFNGDKTSKNTINLQGDGNMVSFSGTVQNATVNLGTGANTLAAGKVNNAIIKAGTATETSKEEQNITIKGGATKMEYHGSDGNDNLSFGGAISESSFDLGAGVNTFTATTEKGKGQNLTNVNITSSAGETTLTAGNLMSKGASGSSSISLGGTSTVSLGNVGAASSITLGTGANTMHLGGIAGGKDAKQVTISMGANSTHEQTLNLARATKNADISFGSGNVTLNSAGAMSNSKLTLGNGTNTVTLQNSKGKDQAMTNMVISAGSASSTTITAKSLSGSANTSSSVTLGNGTNKMSLSGSIGQNTTITLGTGSNTIDAASINGTKKNKVNITVTETDKYSADSKTTLTTSKGGASNLNFTGNSNADSLSFAGGVSNSTLDVGAGANSLTAVKKSKQGKELLQAMNNVTITGATAGTGEVSSMEMKVGALKGKTTLTLGGSNDVTLGSVGAGTTIDLGLGSSNLTIEKGIAGGTSDAKKVTISFGSAGATTTNSQTVTIKGNVKGLNYKGVQGNDTLKIIGSLSSSTIDLGGGTNSMSVQDEASHGKTITNTTIKSTEAGSNTNNITAGNLVTTGKGNTKLELTGGGGVISVGNVSGNTQISTGTGSTTFTAGKFSGPKVSYTSEGEGSFIVGEISNKATVDFSKSTGGATLVGTNGTGGLGKANGQISDATLKFGSNAVTLIAGGTDAAGSGGGSKNMTNVTIEGSNAKSFTLRGTNLSGNSTLNLGGTVSMTLTGTLGGKTSINATGNGSTSITVKDILGTSKDSRVNINLSESDTSSLTVTGDATNFDFKGGTGDTDLTFGSINQGKRTSFAANINVTNADTGSDVVMTVNGKGKNVTYTGTDNGTDTLKLGGEILSGTINLGGGNNTVQGTGAGTAAGGLKNTTISDTAGANTTMSLTSVENSGSGSGGVNMNGDIANVSFSGTVTSNVNMNAKTSNVTASGTVGKANSTKTTNFTYGSAATTGTLTFTGNSDNLKVADAGTGALTVNFSGGKHTKTTVNMTSVDGNALNLDAEMNGLMAELGNSASGGGVDGSNTVTVSGNTKFGAGKDAANVTFKGTATVGHGVNAADNYTLSNMNITSRDAAFTLAADKVENVTASLDTNKNATLQIADSATNLAVTGNGSSSGNGTLTIGSAGATVFTNLSATGWGSGAMTVLGASMNGGSFGSTGDITFGTNTNKMTTTGTVTMDAGSAGNITLNVTKVENLLVNNANNLSLTGTTNGASISANIKGNLTGTDLTSLGTGNFTVGGTANLGGATTEYGTLNATITGVANILGKNISSGGDMTFKAAGSKLEISGAMKNVNAANASAGVLTIGTATTTYTGGELKNTSNGTLTVSGASADGTIINGGSGTVSGDFSGNFTGTYVEGSKGNNTLDVGGIFTGSSEGTAFNKTTFTGGTVASSVTVGASGVLTATDVTAKLTVSGGTATVDNLKADAGITAGKLLVDKQESGTIYGKGTRDQTLISVGTQDAAAKIEVAGTQTQVGTANGKVTTTGAAELLVGNLKSGASVDVGTGGKFSVNTHTSGGKISLADKTNLVGYGAADDTLLNLADMTFGGSSYQFTNTAATTVEFDVAGTAGTGFGKNGTKVSMPGGSNYTEV